MSELSTALVEEATKKSGLIWVGVDDLPQPHPVWHVWQDGAAYVVVAGLNDEVEQPLTELAVAERATVTVRSKDKGSRLISWTADVAVITPGSAEWETITPVLAKDRLNAPDGEEQIARWARSAYVVRLTPTGEVTEAPGSMPDGSQAARPLDTRATRAHHRPRMFGAKRRRADR